MSHRALSVLTRRAALIGGAGALAGCTSPLGLFDAVTPYDAAARVATDVPYGSGPRRRLDVYTPPRAASAPAVVFFYGGSWRSGSKTEVGFVGAALAARGFVTVIPDYRIVPEVAFPDFIADGAAAVRWTRQHAAEFGGDGSRVVLVGHSAGAYIAMMLALDRRYLGNDGGLRAAAGLAGPYDFLPIGRSRALEDAFGRAPDLRETQPATFARADAPPLLLLWGEDDRLVSSRSHTALAGAVRAAGGQAEVRTYPALGHAGLLLALSRSFRHRAPVLADVAAFALTHAAPPQVNGAKAL